MEVKSISMTKSLIILLSILIVTGCAATKTFHQTARAGDTVAIACGWQGNWSRDNITIYVRENGGSTWVPYPANDPSIRAVVNFYPDPVSSMVVSNRTGQNITPFAQTYAGQVNNNFTSGSRDWFNTVVFFDLPQSMSLGVADISIEEASDPNNYVDTTVDIVENMSGGKTHDFEAQLAGALSRQHLASLERARHYSVTLSGTGNVPHAVQMDFTHDPDKDNGGVGKAYVVDPISGMKNISWSDDGTNLRVIIMPADGVTFTSFKDLKFYVAGGVTNLTHVSTSTQAYNINGEDELGVAPPTVAFHNIVINSAN